MKKKFALSVLFYSFISQAEVSQYHFSSGAYITYDSETKVFTLVDEANCTKSYSDIQFMELLSSGIHSLQRMPTEIDAAGAFVIDRAIKDKPVTPFEVPKISIGTEISEESFNQINTVIEDAKKNNRTLGFGELERIMVSLETNNDNVLMGAGRKFGLKKNSSLEGDDFGYTFGIALNTEAQFENGMLALNLRSDLYSAATRQAGKSKDEERRNYVRDIDAQIVDLKVRKDISGKFFVDVDLGFTNYSDQSGVAMALQNSYHAMANKSGVGGRLDKQVDHMQDFTEISTGLSVGRKFTLYKDNTVEISGSVQVGAELRSRIGDPGSEKISPTYNAELQLKIREAMGIRGFASQGALSSEQGADAFVTMNAGGVNQVQTYVGVSRVEPLGDYLKIYRDEDMNHRLGFRFIRKIGGGSVD